MKEQKQPESVQDQRDKERADDRDPRQKISTMAEDREESEKTIVPDTNAGQDTATSGVD